MAPNTACHGLFDQANQATGFRGAGETARAPWLLPLPFLLATMRGMRSSRTGQLACWILADLAAFAAPTSAQTIWNVAPPDIQSVIQQASPGDVLVLTSGGTFPDYHRGDANAVYGLFLTPATTATAVALFSEPVWIPGAVPLTAGLLDPLGVATHTIAVPNLPALQHSPVWCQAASAAVLTLRASTLTGGVVR